MAIHNIVNNINNGIQLDITLCNHNCNYIVVGLILLYIYICMCVCNYILT